jgi:hypothetical protein
MENGAQMMIGRMMEGRVMEVGNEELCEIRSSDDNELET